MGITLKNNKSVTKNMTIKGDNGVGIKTITSGTPVITEEKTTTPITVTLTDETTQNFNVEAKNGSGGGKLYRHCVSFRRVNTITTCIFYNTQQAAMNLSSVKNFLINNNFNSFGNSYPCIVRADDININSSSGTYSGVRIRTSIHYDTSNKKIFLDRYDISATVTDGQVNMKQVYSFDTIESTLYTVSDTVTEV